MYCRNCGQRYINEKVRQCRTCGAMKGYGIRYCSKCGFPFQNPNGYCYQCGTQNFQQLKIKNGSRNSGHFSRCVWRAQFLSRIFSVCNYSGKRFRVCVDPVLYSIYVDAGGTCFDRRRCLGYCGRNFNFDRKFQYGRSGESFAGVNKKKHKDGGMMK